MRTLNYIGSKHTLFKNIYDICDRYKLTGTNSQFADLFAGTGTVGHNMTGHFGKVVSNDMEYFSYVILIAVVQTNYSPKLKGIIEDCNKLAGVEGLIFLNFAEHEIETENPFTGERMFFTGDNAKKADAIRQHIDRLEAEGEITELEKMFLIASLLVSIDKVANTSSVYGAYLKQYKAPALKPMIMVPIHEKTDLSVENQTFNQDVNTLIEDEKFDVVYLDPPYNQRQYSGNYSPLNFIALYSEDVEIRGKTGLIKDYNKSEFCSKVKVRDAFVRLINSLNCNHLILSYNDEGLMSFDELRDLLMSKGGVHLVKIRYKKFKARQEVDKAWVYEYLWYVDTNEQGVYDEEEVELIK
jgi:adenine-specific DNA-methyltransferase